MTSGHRTGENPPSARARHAVLDRELAIEHTKSHLLRHASPRLDMTFIVGLAGGFGLVSSFILLQLGMNSMVLRYPIALSLAYAFFLALIWLWLRRNNADFDDLPDLGGLDPAPAGPTENLDVIGDHGGQFGGGGASSSFDAGAVLADEAMSAPLKAVKGVADHVPDVDELGIPLMIIALAVGLSVASLYVIHVAPALFAEAIVDGALSYALLRRLKKQESRHWLSGTVRHTALPFVATAIFLTVLAAGMTAYTPGAHSIGEVFERTRQAEAGTGPARAPASLSRKP